ncbi:MAG: hypothetical protein WC879_03390 [Melioribacteraceae bacterium]
MEPYDARFLFAMKIYNLQNAGYPAERLADILTEEQWEMISELKATITEYHLNNK